MYWIEVKTVKDGTILMGIYVHSYWEVDFFLIMTCYVLKMKTVERHVKDNMRFFTGCSHSYSKSKRPVLIFTINKNLQGCVSKMDGF